MILYFSATGNSRFVAGELAGRLGGERLADIGAICRGEAAGAFTLGDGERVGFVFPVHSWGMPKGLDRVIASLRFEGAGRHYCYMVCTCGDDTGLVALQWRRSVVACGLLPSASFSVFMPNTYVLLPGFDVDSGRVASRKLRDAPPAVARIAGMVESEREGDFTFRGRMARLKSKVIYPLFMRSVSDRKFRVDASACASCGKCAAVCPAGNIRLDASGMPHWSGDCLNCLACYHYCPRRCVEFGRRTLGKGRYFFRGISEGKP